MFKGKSSFINLAQVIKVKAKYMYEIVVVEYGSEKEVKPRDWYRGEGKTGGEGLAKKLF